MSHQARHRKVKRKQEWTRGYLAAFKDVRKGHDPEYKPKQRERGGKW